MLWITAILPLRRPPSNRAIKADQNVVESPVMIIEAMVPKVPNKRIGFLPALSERPPQYKPVRASASVKDDMSIPVYNAASSLSSARKPLTIGNA